MADTTTDALVNAMNVQSERSVLGQFGVGWGSLSAAIALEEARRVRDSAHTDEEMAEGFGHASERLADQSEALSVQAEKNAAALAVQAEKIGAATALAAATNTGSIILDSTKNAAASALSAAVNTAAIQASLAECCCELKERIHAEGEETRDLINAQSVADLRERLATANAALLSVKAQVIV